MCLLVLLWYHHRATHRLKNYWEIFALKVTLELTLITHFAVDARMSSAVHLVASSLRLRWWYLTIFLLFQTIAATKLNLVHFYFLVELAIQFGFVWNSVTSVFKKILHNNFIWLVIHANTNTNSKPTLFNEKTFNDIEEHKKFRTYFTVLNIY